VKLVTYADKSLLIDDPAADALLAYAAAVARAHTADTVKLHALGVDGKRVEATFLLVEGAHLLAETAADNPTNLYNDEVVEYMKKRTKLVRVERQNLALAADADPDDFSLLPS
jgi:hypothetical protein